ncbi:transmembrane protein 138 isoform X4 [Myotis yumanensis]
MFFNTFVFQAGLVSLLFHKFKGTIVLTAVYFALSIALHVWVMNLRWKDSNRFVWTEGLQTLFVSQRLGATCGSARGTVAPGPGRSRQAQASCVQQPRSKILPLANSGSGADSRPCIAPRPSRLCPAPLCPPPPPAPPPSRPIPVPVPLGSARLLSAPPSPRPPPLPPHPRPCPSRLCLLLPPLLTGPSALSVGTPRICALLHILRTRPHKGVFLCC